VGLERVGSGDRLVAAIAGGAVMSTINVTEVLSAAAGRGAEPRELAGDLAAGGVLDGAAKNQALTMAVLLTVLAAICRACARMPNMRLRSVCLRCSAGSACICSSASQARTQLACSPTQ
jgi:hypothetical protein